MARVTIGFIGVGNILGSHLAALEVNPDYELVAVCRRSEPELSNTARELGCAGFTDYRDLLAERPDVVLVSLPHGLHAQVTIEAFESGCHVLVEKPMATTVADCNRMLGAAERLGRRLIVTESASFNAGAMLTGRKFAAGELSRFFTGRVPQMRPYFHAARPAWFLDPGMSGGGMFANVGLHRLATARACLPGLTPVSVSASVSRVPDYEIEACTAAMVKYRQGGAMLYEEVGYYPRPDWLAVMTHMVFEAGVVTWDADTWRIVRRDGTASDEPLPPQEPAYGPVYANMLRALSDRDYGPKAWQYAQDVAIVQAAYASAREGGQIDLAGPDWAIRVGKD